MAIENILKATLEELRTLSRSETVFGDPVQAGEVTIIPVSRLSAGFAVGGNNGTGAISGAGSGGGVSVNPVAFIVINGDSVKVHPIEKDDINFQKLLSMAPDLLKRFGSFLDKSRKDKKEKE